MPIIYVHGVNTHSSQQLRTGKGVSPPYRRAGDLEGSRERFDPGRGLVPVLGTAEVGGSPAPARRCWAMAGRARWCATKRWSRSSPRPRSGSPRLSDPFTSGQEKTTTVVRLEKLDDGELADLVVLTLATEATAPIEAARIGVAADKAVRDKVIRARIKAAAGLDGQLKILADAVEEKLVEESELEAHGSLGDFFRGMKDRVGESTSRLSSKPAVAASVLIGELHPRD